MAPESGIGSLLRQVDIGMRVDSESGKYYWSLGFLEPYDFAQPLPVL